MPTRVAPMSDAARRRRARSLGVASGAFAVSLAAHAGLVALFAALTLTPSTRPRLSDVDSGEAVTQFVWSAPEPAAIEPATRPPTLEPVPPEPEPMPEPAPVADEVPEPEPQLEPEPAPPPVPVVRQPELIAWPTEPPPTSAEVSAPPPPPPLAEARPAPRAEPKPPPAVASAAAAEPVASFSGVEAKRAATVVYAVDVSGVMASSLKFVLAELDRAVGRLSPEQSFQVVMFRERVAPRSEPTEAKDIDSWEEPASAEPPVLWPEVPEDEAPERPGRERALWLGASARLLAANPEHKRLLRPMIDAAKPFGRSDPLRGLRAALALRPQVVFLLSRGIKRSGAAWGQGHQAILAALDRLNPKDPRTGLRPVVIKTVQFLEDDPTGLMQAIAEEHGDGPGSYTVVTLSDLQRPAPR